MFRLRYQKYLQILYYLMHWILHLPNRNTKIALTLKVQFSSPLTHNTSM